MNILIVDDTELNLVTARDLILQNKIKCNITLCNSGEKAIDIINSEHIDIVLLDIIMPKLSGLDVLKLLKKSQKLKDLIVIMFTSITDTDYLKISFDLGASDFVNKPIEPIEFLSRFKSAIRLKEYQKSLIESYSELKKNNAELKKVNAQLQQAHLEIIHKEKLSSIGRFAAAIAHEINTPLGYISSNFSTLKNYGSIMKNAIEKYKLFLKNNEKLFLHNTEALEEINEIAIEDHRSNLSYIVDDSRELLSETSSGIIRIGKIINNIITFATFNVESEFVINPFHEIISESMLIMNSELRGETIENLVDLHLDLIEKDEVLCNRVEIQHVIINVLQNAIYYTKKKHPNKKGTVSIHTYLTDSHFCCDIKDSGAGIPADEVNKIFEPFFTTKDIGEGLGLGLSISYDIICHGHNGNLYLKEVSEEGCIFSIEIPLTI